MKVDPFSAELSAVDRAVLEFAHKLTVHPAAMQKQDVEGLRGHGLGDTAIHDVVQVTALFNYYNRLADGLGIDPEEEFEDESWVEVSTAGASVSGC